jgi:tRNA dimethylallyltransferase
MQLKNNNETLVILGPTATGKTSLAVQIAEKYNAEIISADSRQVYKYLNIGTGKDLDEYKINNKIINHHLIDIIDPNKNYSVYNFQKDFTEAYKKITSNKKKCIICGGTGLYIESLLLNYDLSSSPPPNQELRKELNKLSFDDLKKYFIKVNKNIIKKPIVDTKNRLIRNIEICLNKKNIIKPIESLPIKNYRVIGIFPNREIVRKNITNRLKDRINNGMIEEVEYLLKNYVNHERLNYFGLEYRFISRYLNDIYTKEELFEKLNTAIHQFSKKQMTFFRRMEKRNIRINWIKKNNINEVEELT